MQLLDLNNQSDLEMKGRNVEQYDITFDFLSGKLKYKKLKESDQISTYIISRELIIAVNAAIVTGRPLLLKGEPGCGKTKLAKTVASYFYGSKANRYYFEWFVKSKSTARDGCYTFDHVQRLRDATVSVHDKAAAKRVQNPDEYIKMGPLGKVFLAKPTRGKPPILLIDEIDKGDIDFPNDLLLELDEMRFAIAEKNNTYISAGKNYQPLVFITSNDERELPPAFLRRCIYYRIPAFSAEILEKIAHSKLSEFYEDLKIKNKEQIDENAIHTIVEKFRKIKKETISIKPPSTSELLDWLKIITYKVNAENIQLDQLIEDKQIQEMALKLM